MHPEGVNPDSLSQAFAVWAAVVGMVGAASDGTILASASVTLLAEVEEF